MTRIFTGLYWRTRSGLFDQSLARNGFKPPPGIAKATKKKKKKSNSSRPVYSIRQVAIKTTIDALVEMTLKGIAFANNWGSVPRALRAEIKGAGGIESWLDTNCLRTDYNNQLRKKKERWERRAAAKQDLAG